MPARVPGLSPGYFYKGHWVFTGCRAHDLDPCPECDVK